MSHLPFNDEVATDPKDTVNRREWLYGSLRDLGDDFGLSGDIDGFLMASEPLFDLLADQSIAERMVEIIYHLKGTSGGEALLQALHASDVSEREAAKRAGVSNVAVNKAAKRLKKRLMQ